MTASTKMSQYRAVENVSSYFLADQYYDLGKVSILLIYCQILCYFCEYTNSSERKLRGFIF